MRVNFFIIILLSTIIFNVESYTRRSDNFQWQSKNGTGFCKRRFTNTGQSDKGYSYALKAHSVCKEAGSSASVDTGFIYVSDNILPVFLIRAFSKDSDSKERYGAALIFRSSFEYIEGGTTPGYDPDDKDIIVKSTVNNFGDKSHLWTPLSVVNRQISGSDNSTDTGTVITITFGSTSTLLSKINITFTVDIVGQPSVFGDKLLTPNSLKISLAINNYKFQNGSSGLVLDATFVSVKKMVDKGKDDNTGTQKIGLQDNDNDNSGGLFSWDTQAFANYTGNGMIVVRNSKIYPDTTFDPSPYIDEPGTVQRIYFSWDDPTKQTFLWDPELGYTDTASNTNNPTNVPLIIGLIVFFIAIIIGGVIVYKYRPFCHGKKSEHALPLLKD